MCQIPRFALVALSNVLAVLDALALAAAGVCVLEGLALLVLALGEVSGLVSAVDAVRIGLANAVSDGLVGFLKGAVVRRTVSVARHDDGFFFIGVCELWCFEE